MYHLIRNSIFKTVFGFVAILLLGTVIVSADPTQSESFSIDGSVQSASSSGLFTLSDFDTTLGTLEGIDVTLTVNSCAKIQIYNSSSSPIGFTDASLSLPGSVTAPGNLQLSTSLTASLDSGTAQPGINTYGSVQSTNTSSQQLSIGSFNLWEDQPNSVVDFTYVKGNPTSKGTDLGNSLFFGGTVGGTGNVTVTYTYLPIGVTATPEPAGQYLSAIVAFAMTVLFIGRKRLLAA